MVENLEQKSVSSVATDFSWATDYSKVKYGASKFLQFPTELATDIQVLISPILNIECKQEVCIGAFNDKQMSEKEFLVFMLPTLQTVRDIGAKLNALGKSDLSVEHKEIVTQLAVRVKLIVNILKAYEIDIAERELNA